MEEEEELLSTQFDHPFDLFSYCRDSTTTFFYIRGLFTERHIEFYVHYTMGTTIQMKEKKEK